MKKNPYNGKVYYCDICAMKHRLPLGNPIYGDHPIAGYCHICGYSGMFIGRLDRDDELLKDIKLTVDEVFDK